MTAIYADLLDVMRRELVACDELLKVLQEENRILGQRKAEGLEEVVSNKKDQLSRIEELAAQQNQTIQSLGHTPDKEGIKQLLAAAPQNMAGELDQTWQKLQSLLIEMRDLNLANGKLLEGNRRQAERVLDIILGKSDKVTTYDQAGATTTRRGPHSYAKV